MTYTQVKAQAQEAANADGFDRGIERPKFGMMRSNDYHVFMLPRRENRYGFETRCEVVSCENLDKCQPGHGPVWTAEQQKQQRETTFHILARDLRAKKLRP